MPKSTDGRMLRFALIGGIIFEGLQNGGVLAMQDGRLQITLDCNNDPEKSLEWLNMLESLALPPSG